MPRRALRYDSQMFVRFRHLLGWVVSAFRSREELLLENLALRQQLLALHAKRPRRRLSSVDKLFWLVLRKVWSGRLTFGVLYCFFVIGHDRRKILHVNVTRRPNTFWIVLHLRQAWGYEQPHKFLIFDRDAKFSADVVALVKQNGTEPVRTALRSPWQNGVTERWVGSVRRDLLDQVIILNEGHLRRLLRDYIRYYHEDRTHLGLGKDTPDGGVAAPAPPNESEIISLPRLGGLHHRYAVAA